MANTRVFSWKIKDNIYAYLYNGSNNRITERITNENVLSNIADYVAGMSSRQYHKAFDELNELISNQFGVAIPGTYIDYYGGTTNNYVLLTGKDGDNKISKQELSEETYEQVKNYIDSKFTESKDALNSDMNDFRAQTITEIDNATHDLEVTIQEVESRIAESNQEMVDALAEASQALEGATQIFDLERYGITAEVLSETVNDASNSKQWIRQNSATLGRLDGTVQEDILPRLHDVEQYTGNVDLKVDNLTLQTNNEFSEIKTELDDVQNKVNTLEIIANAQGGQIQSNWNQTDTEAPDFIKNKSTNVSQFTNDAGYVSDISGKYDKTGGTISGDVKVEGDFTLDIEDDTYDAGITMSGSLDNNLGAIMTLQGYADNTNYRPIIRNIGTPSSDYDAATKKYVDDSVVPPNFYLVELNLDGSVNQKAAALTYANLYPRVTNYKKSDYLDVLWENGQGTNQYSRFYVPCVGITEVNNGNIIFLGDIFYAGNGQNMTMIFSLDTNDVLTTILSLPTQETFLNKVSSVVANSGSTIYYPTTKAVYDEFQRKPVVVWKAADASAMLGAIEADISSTDPAWQLTNLDMTGFKRIKVYTKSGQKSSGIGIPASTTPAVVVEMSLDPMAAGPYNGHFLGSALVQKPNDINILGTIAFAVSSDKTKFVVLRMTSLYGTGATANSDANALVFMIEGYYD